MPHAYWLAADEIENAARLAYKVAAHFGYDLADPPERVAEGLGTGRRREVVNIEELVALSPCATNEAGEEARCANWAKCQTGMMCKAFHAYLRLTTLPRRKPGFLLLDRTPDRRLFNRVMVD